MSFFYPEKTIIPLYIRWIFDMKLYILVEVPWRSIWSNKISKPNGIDALCHNSFQNKIVPLLARNFKGDPRNYGRLKRNACGHASASVPVPLFVLIQCWANLKFQQRKGFSSWSMANMATRKREFGIWRLKKLPTRKLILQEQKMH